MWAQELTICIWLGSDHSVCAAGLELHFMPPPKQHQFLELRKLSALRELRRSVGTVVDKSMGSER